ncbi:MULTISPECIES: type II toxin-antitoxin system prevent-host-death family antitoxin [Glutamicibacter]|uniref:type II toxin-antitoxin system prevent-host-death family antitoxin n=1 Tax=Glutamicibacter TaxID=1742989 RepID=UPI0003B73BE2
MSKTITSREFNQDVSAAKRAAMKEPVMITDHGRPSHVLLSAEEYDRITKSERLVGDFLWAGEEVDYELDIPARTLEERDMDL